MLFSPSFSFPFSITLVKKYGRVDLYLQSLLTCMPRDTNVRLRNWLGLREMESDAVNVLQPDPKMVDNSSSEIESQRVRMDSRSYESWHCQNQYNFFAILKINITSFWLSTGSQTNSWNGSTVTFRKFSFPLLRVFVIWCEVRHLCLRRYGTILFHFTIMLSSADAISFWKF